MESDRSLGAPYWGRRRVDQPSDWKPMTSVGAGVREIRIHADGEYRVLYLATRPDAVYVLHAFVKKRQRTAKLDLDLARARLKELFRARRWH
jgi:phage-related protein